LRELVRSEKARFHVGKDDNKELVRDHEGRCPICSVGYHLKGVDNREYIGHAADELGLKNADVIRIARAADSKNFLCRHELLAACGLGGDA
jgi:hypothetical protein